MKTEAFKTAYNASRNGADHMIRHGLLRRLVYSDGVQECAEAGCYWLLDIIGTEVIQAMKRTPNIGIVTVNVEGNAATLTLELEDDKPPAWKRYIEFTDAPEGKWTFYVQFDGADYVCILPSEY